MPGLCGSELNIMLIVYYPNREIRVTASKQRPVKRDSESVFREILLTPEQKEKRVRTLLDLLPQPSQPKERKRSTPKKMCEAARHMVMQLGATMRDEDKARQVFMTGTLPGSTHEALTEFARLSPSVVKLVQTYVPREIQENARSLAWVYVWELQKRGALHIHMACECPTEKAAKRLVESWPKVWEKVLYATQKKASTDLFEREHGGSWASSPEQWQTDAELVQKSVARYLSKYCSKGSDNCPEYFPRRWYGASTALRTRRAEWIKRNSFCLPFRIAARASIKRVKQALGKLFDAFSPKGGKDVSCWYQETSVSYFGYLKETLDIGDFLKVCWVEALAFGESLIGEKAMMSIEEKIAMISREHEDLWRKMPYYARVSVMQKFRTAMGTEMKTETITTQEGFTHYLSTVQYECTNALNSKKDGPLWAVCGLRAIKRLTLTDSTVFPRLKTIGTP